MTSGVLERLMNGRQVCAVLVTYHPDPELAARVSRTLPQVGALVLVDNGSSESVRETLRAMTADARIGLIENGANLGVARALNLGIERARSLGFNWVLLLDQDTLTHADMVSTLIATRAAFALPDRLAVVGSGYAGDAAIIVPSSMPAPNGPAAHEWQEVESVITSGSLIDLTAHAVIGPFRDPFFIDYVDTEYCLRARTRGYSIIKTTQPIMSHAIGAPTRHEVLWMSSSTTNHSPDRRYYMARNDTILLREYGGYALGVWSLKSLVRRLRTCKRILLYEPMKGRKIAAVAAGWWDGVRGRLGPR
jgi:rhamnosyltransferase